PAEHHRHAPAGRSAGGARAGRAGAGARLRSGRAGSRGRVFLDHPRGTGGRGARQRHGIAPMWLRFAAFELRRHLRSAFLWIAFGLTLLLSYLLFIAVAGAFPGVSMGMGAGGKLMVNSPHALASFVSGAATLLILVIGPIS